MIVAREQTRQFLSEFIFSIREEYFKQTLNKTELLAWQAAWSPLIFVIQELEFKTQILKFCTILTF